MTSLEKTEIKDTLMRFISSHPTPKHTHSSWLNLFQHKILSPYGRAGVSKTTTKIIFSTLAIVLFLGGSLTYTSANALPGDFLYPVKISIRESIEGTLKTEPEEKLAWQEIRIERRLEEIKTLKTKKGITEKQVLVAKTVLQEHVDDLKKTVAELKEDGKQDVILATGAKLLPQQEAEDDSSNINTTQVSTSLIETVLPVSSVESESKNTINTENVTASQENHVSKKGSTESNIGDTQSELKLKKDLINEVEKQLGEIQKTVKEASTDPTKEEKKPSENKPIDIKQEIKAVEKDKELKIDIKMQKQIDLKSDKKK